MLHIFKKGIEQKFPRGEEDQISVWEGVSPCSPPECSVQYLVTCKIASHKNLTEQIKLQKRKCLLLIIKEKEQEFPRER